MHPVGGPGLVRCPLLKSIPRLIVWRAGWAGGSLHGRGPFTLPCCRLKIGRNRESSHGAERPHLHDRLACNSGSLIVTAPHGFSSPMTPYLVQAGTLRETNAGGSGEQRLEIGGRSAGSQNYSTGGMGPGSSQHFSTMFMRKFIQEDCPGVLTRGGDAEGMIDRGRGGALTEARPPGDRIGPPTQLGASPMNHRVKEGPMKERAIPEFRLATEISQLGHYPSLKPGRRSPMGATEGLLWHRYPREELRAKRVGQGGRCHDADCTSELREMQCRRGLLQQSGGVR
mmetsp:Transcript_17389/g.34710  ORF Transcript_17389/g.34710 Transcript_17389/m.34710 type:complete len:284 (+) Transcript_17389:1765-2616(+)